MVDWVRLGSIRGRLDIVNSAIRYFLEEVVRSPRSRPRLFPKFVQSSY